MNDQCPVGATNTANIKSLLEETKRLAAVDELQWQAINALRNRLPVWALLVISLLTGLLGILAGIASSGG